MSLDTSLLFPLMYMVIRKRNDFSEQACDDTGVTDQYLALSGDAL